ncbi:GntR family transcriptional regulator [Neobacillus sp. PS2-9]|uniref:GntR family transcriptional regulator n=1 Tax=Neobacillus sp. PS2-9 TaxID=3070676 RepID=UPI0027DEE065|nr:GntR family transcriptional regulator [Neobacillus sp. PS2-9]WML56645.1 GntR family transcriptional regulator [Neobacillus sp. PS2-9]
MVEKLLFDNLNLNERVYVHLREKIINNILKPGSKIEYEQLMVELGISRTPLRDALNRLQHDKLIEIKPRSGTYVGIPTPKDIQEVYDVRKSLESLAIANATKTITKEECQAFLDEADIAELELKKGNLEPFFLSDRVFHQKVICRSDNSRLIAIMKSLEVQVRWFGIIMTINHERPYRAISMHREIIKAMYDRRVNDAKSLMEQHIDEVREDILSDFL